MKKKRVLIDMDNVVCNYTESILELAALRFNLPKLKTEDVPHFYTEKAFPEKYRTLVDELSLEPLFFLNLQPIPGVLCALSEMFQEKRLDAWVCSSPKKTSPFCHSEKFLWLQKHLGQVVAERLILTRDKTLVSGDCLIDDKPTITGVNLNPAWEHIVFDQPYNRHIKSQKRLVSWQDWKKVLL